MDNNNVLRIPVMLKMNDGREMEGDLLVNLGGQLERTLNSEALFIKFEDETGLRFIAKTGILEAVQRQVQRRAA